MSGRKLLVAASSRKEKYDSPDFIARGKKRKKGAVVEKVEGEGRERGKSAKTSVPNACSA